MGDRPAWGEFCPSGADRPKAQARGGFPSLINATWDPGTLLFTPTTLRTGQLLRSQESADHQAECKHKHAVQTGQSHSGSLDLTQVCWGTKKSTTHLTASPQPRLA